MTLLAWVAVALWVVGGFLLGLAAGVYVKRSWDDETPGLALIGVWLFAPLAAGALLTAGLVIAAGQLVNRAERRVPLTPAQTARRIKNLERDLRMGNGEGDIAPLWTIGLSGDGQTRDLIAVRRDGCIPLKQEERWF